MENYRKLGARLRRFAELVAAGETATEAVRQIRPKARCPKQQAWQWRHLPQVAAAIKELQADTRAAFAGRELRHKQGIYNRANADRSLIAAAVLFGAEAARLPQDPREWPQELKDCIEGVRLTKQGPEVLLSDRNTASRLFSQHMGWIAERHELTGKDGAPLVPRSVDDLTDEQLAAIAAGGRSASAEPPTRTD